MRKRFIYIALIIISMIVCSIPSYSKTYYGFGFEIVPKYINNTTKMTVSNVVSNSSADQNNMKNGAIINKINGKDFTKANYTDVLNALYMNTKLQILLENNEQPIEIYADTPISKKNLKKMKYLEKSMKYFTKKKLKNKDIVKAYSYLTDAINSDPNDVFLRYIRVNITQAAIQETWIPELAEILIQDYIDIFNITNNPDYIMATGDIYIKLNDPSNAEKYYNKAIQTVNNNSIKKQVYFRMFNYYYGNNEFESFLTYYNKLLPITNNEEKLSLYYSIADKYKSDNNIESAVAYYNKFISLTKSKKEKQAIYLIIAEYYSNTNEYSKAISYWNKFLQMSTTNKEKIMAYQYISYLYDKAGNYNLAVQNAQKILNLNPKDLYAIEYMLTYYFSQKKYASCLPYVTKLIYLVPEEKNAYYLSRSLLYNKLNNLPNSYKDAQIVYNDSINREQKMAALYLMIEAKEKLIANSLNGIKSYFKQPSWKDFSPAAYIYVIGDENSTASYWANRRTTFYDSIDRCRSKYSAANLTKCYTDVVKKEEQLNNKYYYWLGQAREQQVKYIEYTRQQALLREQYNNQQRLQEQLINGLYRVQTAPQNYNVNVNGTINSNVNMYGTMYHRYGY